MKTAKSRTWPLIASLLMLSLPVAAVAQQQSPEIRYLANGIRNSRETIRYGQGIIRLYEFTPRAVFDTIRRTLPATKLSLPPALDKSLPKVDAERTRLASWYYASSKLAMYVSGDPISPLIVYERLVSNDGTARRLQALTDVDRKELGTYYAGLVDASANLLKFGIWSGHEEFDPRYHAFFYGTQPLDQWFQDGNTVVYQGEEQLEGAKCMKAELTMRNSDRVIFWVDVDHGFILRRFQEYKVRNGKTVLTAEKTVSQIIEGNGNWLPTAAETKVFLVSPEPNREQPATIIRRFSMANASMEAVQSPEAYILDWPLGTNVTDQMERKKYAVSLLLPRTRPATDTAP